jgi:hypothetical protein
VTQSLQPTFFSKEKYGSGVTERDSPMTICKKAQTFIFSTFLLFLTALAAHGAEATFSWNANTEPTLSGYKIHYGTSSRNYSSVVDVGLPAAVDGWIVHSVDGLLEGNTYYF